MGNLISRRDFIKGVAGIIAVAATRPIEILSLRDRISALGNCDGYEITNLGVSGAYNRVNCETYRALYFHIRKKHNGLVYERYVVMDCDLLNIAWDKDRFIEEEIRMNIEMMDVAISEGNKDHDEDA